MRSLLLFSALVLASASSAFASCPSLLEGDNTPLLTSYLAQLTEQNVIGDVQLVNLADALKRGEVVNPITEEEAATDSNAAVHRDGIEKLISDPNKIDRKMLSDWLNDLLVQRGHEHEKRNDAQAETLFPFQKMKFNRVEAGVFDIRNWNDVEARVYRQGRLASPIEMMSHLVTQYQWAMIMQSNPSHFTEGDHSVSIQIGNIQIKMQPDNPVESVTGFDLQNRFLPKLNQMSRDDDPLLYELIPDHHKGDRYRLPTEDEWVCVAYARDKFDLFRNKSSYRQDVLAYGWFSENSKQTTHPVGERDPIIVDGQPFYDMHGNVSQLVEIPPEHLATHQGYSYVRGSNANMSVSAVDWRAFYETYKTHIGIGFRLVRERAP